ncbi:hypothetical protein MA05_06190 [Comamonas aquatica]|uniref:NAD(P)-binding domain-containing protein n=1 Tax=Comamonas aquatica TaxID=225991 RepID=UPI0005EC0B06
MNLIVIGAGAWGTALAIGAARHTAGHQVTLWARNAQQVQEMQAARSNPRYLPDMAFPDGLQVSAAPLAQAVQGMDLVIIATPMSALRSTLQALAAAQVRVPVAWLCKGFEAVPAGQDGKHEGL